MPKQTFYNLPEEKRERLIDAIYQEFSRVPYEDVSINKIIGMAKIPRGSFYQYFEDKHDVLEFLLEEYQKEIFKQTEESLKKNNGDIFAMFLDLMDFTFSQLKSKEEGHAWMQILSDMRINVEAFTMNRNYRSRPVKSELIEKMFSLIDKNKLDIREDDDLESMLRILIPYAAFSFAQTFRDTDDNYNANRERFRKQLALIKRGFAKKEETKCLEPS